MVRTDWKYDDVVTEKDLNQIGQEINEKETPTGAQNKADIAEQNSKAYTDQQITLVMETGIPKLNVYEYKFNNVAIGTTEIEIPLETFDKQTDTVKVYINTVPRDTDYFTVGTNKIILNSPLTVESKVTIEIWKNIPIGEEGSVSGQVIAIDSLPKDRVQGWVDLESEFNSHKADNTAHGVNTKVSKTGDNMTGELTINANKVWHAGNDGHLSGLDADLLDGRQGDYYMNAIATSLDADPNTTTLGMIVTSHANVPTGSGYWYINTLFFNAASTESSRAQTAIKYNIGNPEMYIRYKYFNNTNWTPWAKVITENDVGVWQQVANISLHNLNSYLIDIDIPEGYNDYQIIGQGLSFDPTDSTYINMSVNAYLIDSTGATIDAPASIRKGIETPTYSTSHILYLDSLVGKRGSAVNIGSGGNGYFELNIAGMQDTGLAKPFKLSSIASGSYSNNKEFIGRIIRVPKKLRLALGTSPGSGDPLYKFSRGNILIYGRKI